MLTVRRWDAKTSARDAGRDLRSEVVATAPTQRPRTLHGIASLALPLTLAAMSLGACRNIRVNKSSATRRYLTSCMFSSSNKMNKNGISV